MQRDACNPATCNLQLSINQWAEQYVPLERDSGLRLDATRVGAISGTVRFTRHKTPVQKEVSAPRD